MNILLLNHYAGSLDYGMEYRPYYLAREWQKLGHAVRIVAASVSHLRSRQPVVAGALSSENVGGVPYVWLRTPYYEGNGVRRALNVLTFVGELFRHYRDFARGGYPDVVIASSTYPLDILPARFMARRWQAKLVFELHDLWPLSPIQLSGMSPRHPFILLMQYAENVACRDADRVISILPNAQAHLESHGMAPHRYFHVPNGIDVVEWLRGSPGEIPAGHRELLAQLHASGFFIIGYTGGHTEADALTCLIEAASALRGQPFAFVLVGSGMEKEKLVAQAQSRQLHHVHFLPPVPKSAIPALLSGMDALHLGWRNKPLYHYGVSPNKLFDYMMAARPVVHSTNSGNDLIAQSGCGFTVPAEDAAAIAEAYRRLAALSEPERRAIGIKGRQFVVANHDYSLLARQFLDALGHQPADLGRRAIPQDTGQRRPPTKWLQ